MNTKAAEIRIFFFHRSVNWKRIYFFIKMKETKKDRKMAKKGQQENIGVKGNEKIEFLRPSVVSCWTIRFYEILKHILIENSKTNSQKNVQNSFVFDFYDENSFSNGNKNRSHNTLPNFFQLKRRQLRNRTQFRFISVLSFLFIWGGRVVMRTNKKVCFIYLHAKIVPVSRERERARMRRCWTNHKID